MPQPTGDSAPVYIVIRTSGGTLDSVDCNIPGAQYLYIDEDDYDDPGAKGGTAPLPDETDIAEYEGICSTILTPTQKGKPTA